MDDEPLILEIDITGGMAAQQQMQAIAGSIRRIQSPVNSAADATQKMVRNLQAADGPAQRLRRSLTQLRQASSSGDPAAMFDAQHRVLQAQKSYNRAQSNLNPQDPSLMDKLKGVLASSRFSLGGGKAQLMPLVGQTMKLLGPEVSAAIGIVGGAAMIAKTAIDAMTGAAADAARTITEFQHSMITSGGTAGETAQLRGIGQAVGAGDLSDLSRQFAEKIASDGSAAAFAAGAGIHDYGGAFSDLDKSKNLLKAVDYLRSIKNDQQAARFARVEGLESLLPLRNLSDSTYKDLKASNDMAGSVITPTDLHNAAEYNAQISRVSTELGTMGTRLKEGVLPGITSLNSLLADFYHELNVGATWLGKKWQELMGVTNRNSEENTARDEHTDAMREHAAALRNGIFGGGSRSRTAMPAGWGGSNANNWHSEARKLGAM